MPTIEQQADPFAAASAVGISDMARSLAATLQAAPARESRRAAALRQHLLETTRALAELSDQPHPPVEFDPTSARLLVEKIRQITADLATASVAVPPGIGIVLQAFAERLLPDTLLILRPYGRFNYRFREHLTQFHALAQQTPLTTLTFGRDVPNEALVLRYPQGEQDNVLLSCNLLRAFRPRGVEQEKRRGSDTFAVWLLGPAYYFACAAELERVGSYNGDATDDISRLQRIASLLEAAGWFDHPHIGPLLRQSRERFAASANAPDAISSLSATEALLQEAETGTPQYLPADFDRDVPPLWERLRQLLPPNDLELESVESMQPAEAVSILNAGWSFALLHMDDMYRILGSRTAEDRYEARQVLNRLLTKGIELSHIARLWRQAREAA
jgi:hypothetical protein